MISAVLFPMEHLQAIQYFPLFFFKQRTAISISSSSNKPDFLPENMNWTSLAHIHANTSDLAREIPFRWPFSRARLNHIRKMLNNVNFIYPFRAKSEEANRCDCHSGPYRRLLSLSSINRTDTKQRRPERKPHKNQKIQFSFN